MQLKSLFIGLLASSIALASPAQLEERAPNKSKAVLTRLTTTDADVNKLNNTLNSFPDKGPIPGLTLISIKNQAQAITYDLGNNTNNAKTSSVWTKAQSKAIAAKVKSIEPDIFALLNNFKAHEPAFANAGNGVKTQVLDGLKQQKALTASQGKAFQAKLTQPYKGQAPKVTATIIAAFNKVIAAYS